MTRITIIFSFALISLCSYSQETSLNALLSEPAMKHASVSICIADAENGLPVIEFNKDKSLIPASIMKLVTTSAALELLGPQYTFKTVIGYTGSVNASSGKLTGDIYIRGGGDPALGSKYFSDHYNDFMTQWISEIKKTGIRSIQGRVITDDSYYDFQPVPARWLWEDAGNYYGAGVYGLSVFDNSYEIHLKTASDSLKPDISGIVPSEYKYEFTNWLISSGTSDEGYVFAVPYSTKGWLAGSVPADVNDFILKASIADPPLLCAKMLNEKLEDSGIPVTGEPTTIRLEKNSLPQDVITITETLSPPLSEIIETLNHESVNLYSEHLIKELGKKFNNNGSTTAGVEVVRKFLEDAGIKTDGLFFEDGSGLSPLDAINSAELVNLLRYMELNGRYFQEYFSSLPEAGKEGTLKNYFKDPVFESRLRAKSGSMTRVRSFAGYITTLSGKKLIFSIIINNYSGPSKIIISGIEDILKDIILYK